MPERTIFRQSAIIAYKRGAEKDVVPRLISWPIIACLWLLLTVFILAGFLAWLIQVPAYVDGSGVALAKRDASQSTGDELAAVLFLTTDQAKRLRVGQPIGVEIGPSAHARGAVVSVGADAVSPEAAQLDYGLGGARAILISQPSVVVTVALDTRLPASIYAGSRVTARIEVGSQRLVELLMDVRNL